MKELTRRELFKELVSKDTLKQVAGAWYGFSKPLTETGSATKKKDSLLETVRKAEMKYARKTHNNGKEG